MLYQSVRRASSRRLRSCPDFRLRDILAHAEYEPGTGCNTRTLGEASSASSVRLQPDEPPKEPEPPGSSDFRCVGTASVVRRPEAIERLNGVAATLIGSEAPPPLSRLRVR